MSLIVGVIKNLSEKGLVRIMGRKEVIGRPFVYGTTRNFLEYFGLNSLDELPDAVFVPLGRRGMEGVTLKECTYACDGKEISLKGVKTDPPEITGKSVEVVIEDWTVECDKCHREFVIRCRIRYIDGARIDTMVSLFDDKGYNLGWLGNY